MHISQKQRIKQRDTEEFLLGKDPGTEKRNIVRVEKKQNSSSL